MRAVGNTASNLTGPRFETQTSRSRDDHVTARSTKAVFCWNSCYSVSHPSGAGFARAPCLDGNCNENPAYTFFLAVKCSVNPTKILFFLVFTFFWQVNAAIICRRPFGFKGFISPEPKIPRDSRDVNPALNVRYSQILFQGKKLNRQYSLR